ncbi:MAG: hypothetical protein Q4Q17_02590 [Tissierellia bacterium]|nr:hypothetical protein [Tissierellia bacterium]
MKILEYGKGKERTFLLVQASCMAVNLWEENIQELQKDFHLIVPIIPGHCDPEGRDFTDVESISKELEEDLLSMGMDHVDGAYGLSMGGSLLIKMLDHGRISMDKVILDGAITPYGYPKWICRLIGIRDYLQGKLFASNKKFTLKMLQHYGYSPEAADKFFDALHSMSGTTLYNVFYSCNNYTLDHVPLDHGHILYMYGEKEKRARKKDLVNVKKFFPHVTFDELKGRDHGQFSGVEYDAFCAYVKNYMNA